MSGARVPVESRLALVELRDSRALPAPWWRWLLVDTDAHTIEGYYRRRVDAEQGFERRLEADA